MNPLNRTNLSREIVTRPDLIDFLKSNLDISFLFEKSINLTTERINLYKFYYQGIGNTRVISAKLPNNNSLNIKLEYENALGNSHYSRYWLPYLFLAEELGIIRPVYQEY